jgi:hypothetical protein
MDEEKIPQYDFRVQRGLPFRRMVEFFNEAGAVYSLLDHTVQCRVRKPPRGSGDVFADNIAAIEGSPTDGVVSLSLTTTQSNQRGALVYTFYLTYPNTEKRAMFKGELLFEDVD